jgi:type I restriction enzyme S subunit
MRISSNNEESQTLAELRDTLLPRLISGEIRIPEAEKTVERSL